jgi:tetratricopeptide (TPR) repeat protein
MLLRYASVIGSVFERAELANIVERSSLAVSRAMSDELREFVAEERAGFYRFRHGLFRDVAYEAMPYHRRRDLHARIGDEIERRTPDAAEEQADLLSLHFHRAQRYDKSWRYSKLAGARAHEKYANVAAAEFYQRALESARRVESVPPSEIADVAEALGDVDELIGSYAEASDAYRRAFTLLPADESDAHMRLLRKQGVVRERLGQYSQALRWYGRGLRRTDHRGHRIELSLAYAGVRYRQGRYVDCTRWCKRVVEDAERAGDRKNLAHAYYLLDAAYTDLGSAESETYRLRALPIYEELGDLVGQANVLNNLGVDAYVEGRWAEALEYYRRSRVARERAGDVVGVATAANNIGEILSDQGRYDEAERYFREAFNIWRSARYQMGVGVATANLGRLATRLGNLKDAEHLLLGSLEELQSIKAENFTVDTEARIAEQLLYAGDPASALRIIDTATDRLSGIGGSAFLRSTLLRLRACALVQLGEPDAAAVLIHESIEVARSLRAGYDIALALQVLADIDAGEKRAAIEIAATEVAATEVAAHFETLGVVRVPPPATRPL